VIEHPDASNQTPDRNRRPQDPSVAELERPVREIPSEPARTAILLAEGTETHQRADPPLGEAEEKFRTIVELAPEAMFIADAQGRLLEVNAAACSQFGYTRAKLLERGVSLIVPPRSVDPLSTILQMEVGSIRILETFLLRADGVEMPVELRVRKIILTGRPAFVAVARDISRRKAAEEALGEREARLRETQQVAQFGFWSWDVDSDTITWSEELYRIAGKDPRLPPPRYAERANGYTPGSWARLDRAVKQALATGAPYALDLEIVRPDGARRLTHARGAVARDHQGRVFRLYGTVQDITERSLAEEALRKAHSELAAIYAHAPVLLLVVDEGLRVEKVNEATTSMAGRPEGQLVGLGPGGALNCLHSLEDPRGCGYSSSCGSCAIRQAVLDSLRNRAWRHDVEAWVPYAEGGVIQERCLLVFTAPLDTPGPGKALVCALDITARKRAEEDLRDREHWLRESQRISRVGSFMLNLTTGLWTSSETMDEIFGIGPDFHRSVETWLALVHPADRQRMTGQARDDAGAHQRFDYEYRIVRPVDGQVRWVHGSGQTERDAAGQPVRMTCTVQDITERRSIEEQLLQAQKLDGLGRLAGGVAHDFNNLLTVINGYGDLVLRELKKGDPLQDWVAEIVKAGERAKELTQQLLAFSRKQVSEPRAVNLNGLVAVSVDMLQRLVGEDIQVVTELSPALGLVAADPGHLHQVLMNLAVNARDAMPGGGRLTLSTAHVEVDQSAAAEPLEIAPGPCVLLSVGDTGMGIPEEIRPHIFDPFFTTKPKGEGTGLGLSTVYGIVRQSGGAIAVESEPGHGATFRIYLPQTLSPVAAGAEAAVPAGPPRGSETVLVVEDQEAVRKFTVAVLKSRGYRVLEAPAGPEALLAVERHSGPLHLLLTDVIMPGMTGKELAERLTALRPETRVLYMSGYTSDVIAQRGLLSPGVLHIAKPFSPDALGAKVREILGPMQSAAAILVADDEEGVRGFFREVLVHAGYKVTVAADGEEALKAARAERFQAMVTDLVMPEREGIETIQTLRKEQPDLKIIAVSGAFAATFLKVAETLGADATMPKPVSADALLATVRRVLE